MIDEKEGGGASRTTDPATGSSAATDVSLREFLTMRTAYERQIADLRTELDNKARELQASEYERRLDSLNNEGARLAAAVAQNVSSDTWKAFEAQYRRDREDDGKRLRAVERFNNKLLGAMGLAMIVVPGITAFIVYILTRHAVPVSGG